MISLKVDNFLINTMNTNHSHNPLKEGSIFKGEILEVLEDLILINIQGEGVIKATRDMNMKSLVGEEISFLVKSNENGKIELKPLVKDEILPGGSGDKSDNYILKILNTFNIKKTEGSMDLIKNLIQYNIPLNEENIIDGIKTLEKLIELTSLKEDDKVVLFESKSQNSEIIQKENLEIQERFAKNVEIEHNMKKDMVLPEKINIKNLLVVDEKSYPEKENLNYLVKEFLGEQIEREIHSLDKIVSFFIRNEVKPSLNNIKNFMDLVKDPIEFSKDFIKLKNLLNELEGKGNFNKVKDFVGNIQLNKENTDEIGQVIKELGKEIGKSELKSIFRSNFNKDLKQLESKIDFLKEMDQDLNFLVLPLNYGKKELDGVLTLLKRNKEKNNIDDGTNIFISLDTNNLGNIKISCQAKLESLLVKINIQEADLELFKSREEELIYRIGTMGYIINSIDYVVDKDLNIMDEIVTNTNQTYFLDLKV